MKKFWMATRTGHSCLLTVTLALTALLFSPICTTALKLNGTTTTSTASTPLARPSELDEQKTTLTSFLQPDVPQTTLNSQINLDELTTQHTSAKRHSSIQVDSSQDRSDARYLTKSLRNEEKKNGTKGESTDDNEQSLSLSSTGEEQTEENTLPSTSGGESSGSEGASTSVNSLEGWNDPTGEGSGVVEGDIIFPPEEDEGEEEDMEGTTAYESLVRPGPTLNPKSFASQLTSKLNRSSGSTRLNNGRLGTRGLSSKSDLNAITVPANISIEGPTPMQTTTKNMLTFHRIRPNRRHNHTDSLASSDNSADKPTILTPENKNNSLSVASDDITPDASTHNSTGFDLSSISFSSRSNLNFPQEPLQPVPSIHPQPQQFHRPRPTQSVINYNTNHNNNLHNRIIKRKKIPNHGRNNSDTTGGGSSLSSIYGNSILSSTLSTNTGENADVPLVDSATTAASVYSDSSLLGIALTTKIDSTTESNSLASQRDDEGNERESSLPATSGFTNSNLTTPDSFEDLLTSGGNGSSPLSSSRAILGFGAVNAATLAANHGKIKRPKPIIVRDHEDSLFVNNISENAALTSENNTSEEIPVSSNIQAGSAGEEEINKPVGSNALPTPSQQKVKRIRPNPRRPLTTRPILDYEELMKSSLASAPIPLRTQSDEPIASTSSNNYIIQAATESMQMQDAIRPSVTVEPPMFSSRKVFKEEFGISHESYGDNHEDGGLEATTEFFSDFTTPYPLILGVRSVPDINESDLKKVASYEKTLAGNNKDSVGSDDGNTYRDYYSEISHSVTPDYGGGNLHKSSQQEVNKDEVKSVSPVTVTVTHTIVETTPHAPVTFPMNSYHNDHDVAKRGNSLQPTPALPSASTEKVADDGQGPQITNSVQFSTSHFELSSSNDADKGIITPAMPNQQAIEPTPIVSAEDMKSVYFTQVTHPHFTSSSYEFTTSRMYTYSFPDHDEEQHHHDEETHQMSREITKQQMNSTHPPEEHQANPEANNDDDDDEDERSSTTIASDDHFFTTQMSDASSSPTKASPPSLPAVTTASSAAVATTTEDNGDLSTPMIDIDVYTPPPVEHPTSQSSTHPSTPSSTTVPSTTHPSSTSQLPASSENNVNSSEEDKKGGHTEPTTSKPLLNEKDKEGDKGQKNDNGNKPHDKESQPAPPPAATAGKEGSKTPYGIGESFGIGSVHVPVMVQMILDVSQNMFCTNLKNFKEMIVMVFDKEKNAHVDPEQIVIYTKPGCESGHTATTESSKELFSTLKPEALIGKASTTSKGTYPLTSPPPIATTPSTHDGKKVNPPQKEPSKEIVKNGTSLSGQSLTLNHDKNGAEGNQSILSKPAEGNSTHKSGRSRRSTKMGTAAKNIDLSSDSAKQNSTEFSVFFYVNDKSGSYDEALTSSFVKLWNDSSRLTNVTNNNNGENNASGNDGSNNNEMFFKRVKKVGMISASHLLSTETQSDENSGIIIAITVASIVAICLFVLGVGLLVMRHRQSQTKFAKRCTPVTLDDYSLDNISVYNSFRRKQRLRGSKRSYTNAAFDDPNAPSKPLNAAQLAAALTDISSLENEFRAIPNITATLDDIPNGAETKNRYANVIPMPDSRVLLTFQEDVPNSDYINANYVRGANGEQKRYIITQGPLEETIVDFWRMVWEQQIRVIMMLTDFAEGGIAKCAEYYPRSETIDCSQLHGDFQITLEKKDVSDHCVTSYLVIKDMERNLRRDVVHFWYHSWPDKGVPASPKITIDFLNRTRKFTKEPIPILIHCSPGTGRSGTIVACDIAMKEYDSQNKLDIPRIVMKIRQDRAGAVQTKEQYVHIYDVLHSYVSRLGSANLESI